MTSALLDGNVYGYGETMTVAAAGDWDSHVLLAYPDESDRHASLASWVQRGLDRREKILYATVPGDTPLIPELEQRGVDVASAVRDGQFAFLPLEEFFPGAGQPALVHGALEEGYPGVRLSAQADAALAYLGRNRYKAIDRLMDELCISLPVSALCQYNAGGINQATLAVAIDSHPNAVQDARMGLRRRDDRVHVTGEVEAGSAEVLARALHRMCAVEGDAELVVDLSELTFVDVAGLRALVTGTEALRGAGGTVFFRGPNGHIRKVMSLLGMDRLPGLALW